MKILDTNLWVFGTLGTSERAARLLDEIEHGETVSAINAYMVQEALNAFDRTPGLTASERDEVKTLFLTRLTRMTGLLEAPSSRDIADSLLDERRAHTQTQLLARITGVQPKDIPILVLAFEHRDREPTILTNDADFAAFAPTEHSLQELGLEHVA
ncbi:PIN domain-containing protein [Saliphagus infecundisoli]|uniref:PIN domain-containing protein n=1 Tax=Saliphagus infecundisoli TaxID=1849069 RepID=A0ABD5QE34_9EURY|nr:PIN domain-containing protein [Saliphagus infecundisoli]